MRQQNATCEYVSLRRIRHERQFKTAAYLWSLPAWCTHPSHSAATDDWRLLVRDTFSLEYCGPSRRQLRVMLVYSSGIEIALLHVFDMSANIRHRTPPRPRADGPSARVTRGVVSEWAQALGIWPSEQACRS